MNQSQTNDIQTKIETTIRRTKRASLIGIFILMGFIVLLTFLGVQINELNDEHEALTTRVTELTTLEQELQGQLKEKNTLLENLRREYDLLKSETGVVKLKLNDLKIASNNIQEMLILFRYQKFEQTLPILDDLITRLPEQSMFHHLRGYAYFQLYRLAVVQAENSKSKTRMLENTTAAPKSKSNTTTLNTQYFESASHDFTQAIAGDPERQYYWGHYHLALLNAYANKPQRTLSILAKALPEHPQMLDFVCQEEKYKRFDLMRNSIKEIRGILHQAIQATPSRIGSCKMLIWFETLEAQIQLNRLGYSAGIEDGMFGSRTETAVQEFQADSNLDITGLITDKLLDQLHKAANNAPLSATNIYTKH